ncbi:putative tRNA pseudouridine synthase Pus10, partial [Diplonema papillatum]
AFFAGAMSTSIQHGGCSYGPAARRWIDGTEQRQEIIRKALSDGLCGSCALRCTGCLDMDAYIDNELERSPVCPMCAGVLQQTKEIAILCSKAIETAPYVDARQFSRSIALPRSCPLRAAQWINAINPQLPGDNARALVTKTTLDLRSIVGHIIETVLRRLNLQFCPSSEDVAIRVTLVNTTADDGLQAKWQAIGESRKRSRGSQDNAIWPSNKHIEDKLASTSVHSIPSLGGLLDAPSSLATATVVTERNPLLLAGRYLKYDREMPQTPWLVGDKRMGKTSLQECLFKPLIPLIFPGGLPELTEEQAKKRRCEADTALDSIGGTKFHSAGREDIDVRMFGSGRPFMFEVPNPPKLHFSVSELQALEAAILKQEGAGDIVPGTFKTVSREYFMQLQEASEQKQKKYRCAIWIADVVSATIEEKLQIDELTVQQKTPFRVLHRRSALTRPKVIHTVRVTDKLNDHWLILEIVTQAGTYIKEFVHGDRGRTSPSVAELCQCPVDILELDVVDVYCDL